MKKYWLGVFLWGMLFQVLSAQEEATVFSSWNYLSQKEDALYQHLVGIAEEQLAARRERLALIQTAGDFRAYQQEVKTKLAALLGKFPERTPLNPVISGTINRPGYRIEKLYFESRPGYFVTAGLFIPEQRQEPAPAILYCSGHAAEGWRSQTYQHIILNYVSKGFIVLAFDPIGQGERYQYFDENDQTRFRPTHEHSYPGTQAFAAGLAPASYLIWDGIRAIDYLVSRPEVDPDRLGIAGRSGGGTQAAYIAAVDDRILAAAPECYLTTFERLLRTRGPQDAEQNIPGLLAAGLDLGDLVALHAPKPTLMVTTTRDIFSIQGARELYAETHRLYGLLGAEDRMLMVEDDAGHASTPSNRVASYVFFQKFLGNPGRSHDDSVSTFDVEELWVAPSGQVYLDLPARTMHDLILEDMQELQEVERTGMEEEHMNLVRSMTGYQDPERISQHLFSGRYQLPYGTLEQFLLKGPGDYFLPLVQVVPEKWNGRTLVLLDDRGKAGALSDSGLIMPLINAGYRLVLPDLSGYGEMGGNYAGGDARIDGIPLNLWYAGILTGHNLVGLRMQELHQVLDFVGRDQVDGLISRGNLQGELLTYCYLHPSERSIIFIEPLLSQRALVEDAGYHPGYAMGVIPGAMHGYDYDDLLTQGSMSRQLLLNPVNARGQMADETLLQQYLPGTYSAGRIGKVDSQDYGISILDFLKK